MIDKKKFLITFRFFFFSEKEVFLLPLHAGSLNSLILYSYLEL